MRPLFCKNCGNRLTNEEALFCEKCGSRIEEVDENDIKVENGTPASEPKVEEPQPKEEESQPKVEEPQPKAEELQPKVEELQPKVEEPQPKAEEVPQSESKEKKPLATWVIAVIVFVILCAITGLGVLTMYLKPDILPSINPWYVEESGDEDIDDEEDDIDNDVNDSDEDIDEDNNESDVAVSDEDGQNDQTTSDEAVSGDDTAVNDSESAEVSSGSVSKPYVPGDDTKDTGIHRYEVVLGDYSWDEAYYDSRRFGDKSYLVHFNSDEEFEYVTNILMDQYSGCIFWVGARREPEKYVYQWANAKNELVGDNLYGLKYWLTKEPSFYDVSVNEFETRVDLFYSKSEGRYVMNDVPENLLSYVPSYQGKIGYILEIED